MHEFQGIEAVLICKVLNPRWKSAIDICRKDHFVPGLIVRELKRGRMMKGI